MKLCIQEEHLHGEEQEIESSKLTTSGSYYFHILAVDNAGNSREYISEAVTIKSGYAISTPQDFQNMGSNLSASYYVVNDIDMNGFNFKRITGCFQGTLNGQGHTISNLTINNTVTSSDGYSKACIFQKARNATFENILFKNVNLTSASAYVGVLMADAEGSSGTNNSITIKKVGIVGSLSAKGYVGSFVGKTIGNIKLNFENCYARTNFSVVGYDMGGFVGENVKSATIEVLNSYWFGKTSAAHRTGPFRGGDTASNNNQSTGGITLTNSFYNKTLFTLSVPEVTAGKGLTTAEFTNSSNFTGWDFDNTWYMSDAGYPELKFN